jgi:hypothetical protein
MLAVYPPPKFTVNQAHLEEFFNTLGFRFIAGVDYNTKHTILGSRIANTQRKRSPQNNGSKQLISPPTTPHTGRPTATKYPT